MNIVNSLRAPVSFNGNKSRIIIPHDNRNVDKLMRVQDELYSVMKEIELKDNSVNFDVKVIKTKERIDQLKRETQEAWGLCPSALKPKMDRLKELEEKVNALQGAFEKVGEDIDNEKPGLILPDSLKEGDKKGLITSTLDIMAAYNSLPKDKQGALNKLQQASNAVKAATITTSELKDSLKELKKENWSFEKLNTDDAKVYKKLGSVLPLGEIKEIVNQQIKEIDKKLIELKENGGKLVPEVGVKIFGPETTGKILALETAKLRRTTLGEQILMPNVIENLDKPDIMLQPLPGISPEAFKIDKEFIPKKHEIKEILELNKPYQPILNKLFPDGLNMYVVPGYFDSNMGELEGGMCLPSSPDSGVWLNSYDNENRYNYFSMLENQKAVLNDVNSLNPSVLKGNKDKARALSHEIAHVISYKLMENDKKSDKKSESSLLITSISNTLSMFDAWKGLRGGVKLNGMETHRSQTRGMSESDLENLHRAVDLEMIAEDIRMAITGENIPATSRLTNIADSSEEGTQKLNNIKEFLRECLLEEKDPTEALIKHMQ